MFESDATVTEERNEPNSSSTPRQNWLAGGSRLRHREVPVFASLFCPVVNILRASTNLEHLHDLEQGFSLQTKECVLPNSRAIRCAEFRVIGPRVRKGVLRTPLPLQSTKPQGFCNFFVTKPPEIQHRQLLS